jgi:hypothetical protein
MTGPTPSPQPPASGRSPSRYVAVFLLLVLFGLLVFSVVEKSPTADEQNHVARGLAYLKTGDLRLSQEHPPGVNAWEAWPLLLDPGVHLPLDSPSWVNAEWYGFADELLWRANDRPQAMVFATRVPVMWLTLILAALTYRWGRALGGAWSGLLALVLTVFDPNILAHGRLTTTDMGVTVLGLVAMWALWRAVHASRVQRVPGWGRWAAAGLAFGALLLTKFSALVLGPVTLLIVLLAWAGQLLSSGGHSETLPRRAGWRSRLRASGLGRWALCLLVLYGVAGLVVWAGYRFTWGPIAPLGGLPGPAPTYWSGIASILQRTGGGSTAFLMGRYSETGWWTYFPVAFAVKTPLPTLVMLALALVTWIWGKGERANCSPRSIAEWDGQTAPPRTRDLRGSSSGLGVLRDAPTNGQAAVQSPNLSATTEPPNHRTTEPPNHLTTEQPNHPTFWRMLHLLCLLLPVLAFWIVAMSGGFNIGYRHIMPSLPFLYVLVGWQVGTWLAGIKWAGVRRWVAAACGTLALWLVVGTLLIAPHYLASFNVLAGGPDGGYRILVDSNLDWGQDLPALAKTFGMDQPVRVRVSWFGAAHPEAYDLAFHPLPGFWRFRGDPAAYGLNPYAPAPGTYAISASNLQGIKLADRDTYAWFREREPSSHVGHSILIYQVEGNAADRAVVLGVPMAQLADEERALLEEGASVRQYDPTTGVLLPLGLPGEDVWFVAPELPAWGTAVRTGPGYVVFQTQWDRFPYGPDRERQDIHFGPYVRMLDHQIEGLSSLQRGPLLVRALWRVEALPHRAAVSFAHLLDGEGRYLAGWDGLTAPATCWQEGDLIVQEYRISLPANLVPGTYQIELGWYDPYTMARWPCAVDGRSVGDRFLIGEVDVKP